jgi:predicted nucleic acid-binding protein/GNAT superfamily N-acetyltransferase
LTNIFLHHIEISERIVPNSHIIFAIMIIERIDDKSRFLAIVKDLGRKNSKTLGFFPEGAFEEHAAKGCVIVARSGKGEFYGYLLYRIVHRGGVWPVGVIVHLCVDEPHRKMGIAKALVNKLRSITINNFLRLEVNCRQDYDATNFWPKSGFIYKGETLGRSGHPILRWEMELRQLPLMALMEQNRAQKTRAVIDMNILYRLQDPLPEVFDRDKILSEEAKALQEDWINEDVELLITPEAFNEIRRNDNRTERLCRRKFADQFGTITANFDDVCSLEQRLSNYFSIKSNESDRSDIRQLAYSIKGDASFFITQDTGLLKKSEELHKEFGIRILSPGRFIGRLDEIIREVEYLPRRLGGACALTIGRAPSSLISRLFPIYQCGNPEERKSQFESKIRNFVAQLSRYRVELCQIEKKPLAFIVYDLGDSSELGIPMIRASRSKLSGTVLRHLLRRAVQLSLKDNRPFVRVTDIHAQGGFEQALEESGFTKVQDQWFKISLPVADNIEGLVIRLSSLGESFPATMPLVDNLVVELLKATEEQDSLRLSDLERRLWPVRILDANIPNFIVSIMPFWAQHLFDEGIARQTLYGGRDDLLLRNENVYYRSARSGGGILSPARVLWYVKQDKNNPMTSMQVRACSLLDEVIISRAKDLYSRFERLGIYAWKDVLRTAGQNANNKIMALRFSNTVILPQPINLQTLRNIMEEEGDKKPLLQSPQRINNRTFARIYQTALLCDGSRL